MIKKGYKVVTQELKSALDMSSRVVTYKVGESVTPKVGCGPLTVFTNIVGAAYFKKQMPYSNSSRIFKCFYTPSLFTSVWDKHYLCPLRRLLEWNTNCLLPDSVDLADEVILVEEL